MSFEPELVGFEILAAHELRRGDVLLDLGAELTGLVTGLRSTDLSEPGDNALAEIAVVLRWRDEELLHTTVIADMLELRVIVARRT
ncbi:hypothetical protein [Gordonia alkaliphila]|uniref:Uncharacterized protein n=1 Tax=Gordonia alkaliphila TaxID=1053547 RepID=A0ABP8YWQ7_9ACTN